MLRRLSVENYALIEKLEMELDPHLNIITGETGAGKSILLGALGLLLGAKNDGSAMKDAARNCVVEGTFDLSGRGMKSFFDENDLDYAPETHVTRMITPAGKSRAFINDIPVQLAQLREFGTRLIDIHSQHQNLILSSEEFRTSALDTVAGNGGLLAQYTAQYARLSELRRQLAALREAAADGRRDEEWLRFQCEELTAANLREGEQAATEAELAVLENADRIGEVLTTLRNAFDADETGILTLLKNSENDLVRIREHYPAAGEYAERIHSVLEELKDIDNAAAADCERIDAGMTVLVVGRALAGIGQYFVGLIGLFEQLFRRFVIGITVRVMLHRQAAIGLLQVRVAGSTLNTQHFVIVTLCHKFFALLRTSGKPLLRMAKLVEPQYRPGPNSRQFNDPGLLFLVVLAARKAGAFPAIPATREACRML